jgi:hypothetical protein
MPSFSETSVSPGAGNGFELIGVTVGGGIAVTVEVADGKEMVGGGIAVAVEVADGKEMVGGGIAVAVEVGATLAVAVAGGNGSVDVGVESSAMGITSVAVGVMVLVSRLTELGVTVETISSVEVASCETSAPLLGRTEVPPPPNQKPKRATIMKSKSPPTAHNHRGIEEPALDWPVGV